MYTKLPAYTRLRAVHRVTKEVVTGCISSDEQTLRLDVHSLQGWSAVEQNGELSDRPLTWS